MTEIEENSKDSEEDENIKILIKYQKIKKKVMKVKRRRNYCKSSDRRKEEETKLLEKDTR